ncbi:ribosome hibernation-promoting factor, HPF/YfiA family [Lentilactobacillus otakiensis]|uniref:Ribosome hibernation promoting factor n=1 Tax=Lentilactobacillus otakiensis DSM 19908 = JCM 15040 TaxID=1423780 RepID=S4PMV9_9LACO|nr:ribosome-associated translation inhibitor RaiA [Lentilactobacillus otakiensis]KRL09444.1 sigma 54 modulation protein ribosomal protein S30EA [Lentilactobacillus otakiensis DSM 19908 = JCM 15040]MBZ3775862.1 ribosome-associated translation inhibitor RaiA [Lentilactobacillus otakiensis]MDV3518252.1 ribosome-associated translation inhibitor RaiA [Lentilactobacillus otakiensis]GAD15545.1 sigma 54 modulation protein/ribosomal protein S30EA [Lentilactobacillus otakiensis DSM 19908 = JCM 15040]
MLIFNIRGENIEVTQAIRDYVEKRISKLEKYFEKDMKNTAHVNLKVYPDKQAKVEVTIPLPYLTLRAEEMSNDLYASVDLVTDKLERQIRKYKTKVNRKSREKGFKNLEFAPVEDTSSSDSDDESKFQVVRTKQLALKPMDNEEAILQMDMLGHDFFIYEDAETSGINIVYRRNDGRYGLIETGEE